MVEFLASARGRFARVVIGIALFIGGLLFVPGVPGVVVMVLGFIPVLEAVLNFWTFAPLFGAPLSGKELHAH